MSLRDFVDAIGERPAKGRGTKAAKRGAMRRASGKLNTRTSVGRNKLDDAISRFLESVGSARAEEVRKAVGGTAAQIRQSMSRLMQARKVSKKGQKRSTEYSWKAGSKSPTRSSAPSKRKARAKAKGS